MERKFEQKELGLELSIGRFARQADGAAWLKKDGTVVLSTATSAPEPEFPGFFPLTVDYREYFSAAGKIPGGYFKREGKFTDKEVLTSRLIDRAIRPFFPSTYFDKVQILSTVYSVSKDNLPSTLSLLASSIALTISKIPFLGPIGAVEIVRIDGTWIIDPTYDQAMKADAKIIVAGNEEGICMLEGNMSGIDEKDLLEALLIGHQRVKIQVEWQKQIAKELDIKKEAVVGTFDWGFWETKVADSFIPEALNSVCVDDKAKRDAAFKKLKDDFLEKNKSAIEAQEIDISQIEYAFDNVFRKKVTDWVFNEKKRVDGRKFDEVREVTTQVSVLPFTHGSSFFQRGHTQALVTATLGSGEDEQKIDTLLGETEEHRFILHYNFPPFSVGEVKPLRGPSRRDVGHGNLAYSAIRNLMPSKEQFPYTVRVVSDILESNGSSSMATVCGTTMALLDAGVPLKKMVSGVAMGLLQSSKGEFQTITDLTGFEDNFGFMDFKVAGTEQGVTAIQMDIKHKGGLPHDVFEKALEQAKQARNYILGKMKETISGPKELSSLVPKIISFKIDTKKIGLIIGPGGKMIKEIIEKTGTTIDTEDDGTVNVFGGPDANVDLAINWIKTLAGQIEPGSIYHGRIKRIADFGIFVEIVPGLDGLLHISQIPKDLQRKMADNYKIGQVAMVEVIGHDPETGRISLRFVK
ncbi:polyribonucleotide nucleotidyltransferase [candidate division TM6 bacterium RIFCSPHIGHO2_12_FULL_32_22]|nr:MAG: polyribonucleotide nucleotidyltransferase [candidate division TM6 bacterium RIFCSPHIGHO2_12_FULL_32_22]